MYTQLLRAAEVLETPLGVVDTSLRLIDANAAMRRCVGFTSLPASLADVLPSMASRRSQRKIKGGKQFSVLEANLGEGRNTDFELVFRPPNTEGLRLVEGIVQSRAQAGQELLASHSRLIEDNNKIIREAKQHIELMLDTVDQGFITLDGAAKVVGRCSRAVSAWLGDLDRERPFWETLTAVDAAVGLSFEMGWDQLCDGFLPIDLTLDQLPKVLGVGDTYLMLKYHVVQGESLSVLVVLTDITAQREREALECAQVELSALLDQALKVPRMFVDFWAETKTQLAQLATPGEMVVVKRVLHTLKGNFSLWGLGRLAAEIHNLEALCEAHGEPPSPQDLESVLVELDRMGARLSFLLDTPTDTVTLDRDDVIRCLEMAQDPGMEQLALMVVWWQSERLDSRFLHLQAYAKSLGARMNKCPFEVSIETGGIRIASGALESFWDSFIHVVRNAVDHGVPDEGEAESGPVEICLWAGIEAGRFVVECRDTGHGIDWSATRAKAEAMGLPAAARADLVEALFSDGLTTRKTVSMTSGRGVGLSAARSEALRLGGSAELTSEPGVGTTVRFCFPAGLLDASVESVLARLRG